MKYTVDEFANQIRKLYPGEYNDLSNQKLTELWLKKYPNDRSKIDLNEKNKSQFDWFFFLFIGACLFLIFILLNYKSTKNSNQVNNREIIHTIPKNRSSTDEVGSEAWKKEQQKAAQEEDESTDENGDIVDPNTANNTTQENINHVIQEQWVNCEMCHGTGVKSCSYCGGTGEEQCRNCYGAGVIDKGTIFSPDTDGRGHTCTECAGRGTKRCKNCYGVGNQGSCFYCGGRGQVKLR